MAQRMGSERIITQHNATDRLLHSRMDCNLQVKTENDGQAYSQLSIQCN